MATFYSIDFQSTEDTEQDLRKFLGAEVKDAQARHIKLEFGSTVRFWVKNSVSIGPASSYFGR